MSQFHNYNVVSLTCMLFTLMSIMQFYCFVLLCTTSVVTLTSGLFLSIWGFGFCFLRTKGHMMLEAKLCFICHIKKKNLI